MARREGIIAVTAQGKTVINHNGIQFETADKSVIAMAARGNVAGAAKRYIGKSSTASALRKANREANKPIYNEVAESLYKKVFKQKDKNKLDLSKSSLAEFRKKYRETIKETEKYIEEAVKDNVGIADNMDRLPASIKTKVDSIIQEEVEKAYSEKGQIENTDISRISNRISDVIEEYMAEEDITDIERDKLDEILGTLEEVTYMEELQSI